MKVTNPLPAAGGADAAALTEALDAIPAEVHRRDRAVIAEDFSELALRGDRRRAGRDPAAAAPGHARGAGGRRGQRRRLPGRGPAPPRRAAARTAACCAGSPATSTRAGWSPPSCTSSRRRTVRSPVSVGLAVRDGYQVDAVRRWVEPILRQYLAPLPPCGPDGDGLAARAGRCARRAGGRRGPGRGRRVRDRLGPRRPRRQRRPSPRPTWSSWSAGRCRSWSALTVVSGTPLPPGEAYQPPHPDGTPGAAAAGGVLMAATAAPGARLLAGPPRPVGPLRARRHRPAAGRRGRADLVDDAEPDRPGPALRRGTGSPGLRPPGAAPTAAAPPAAGSTCCRRARAAGAAGLGTGARRGAVAARPASPSTGSSGSTSPRPAPAVRSSTCAPAAAAPGRRPAAAARSTWPPTAGGRWSWSAAAGGGRLVVLDGRRGARAGPELVRPRYPSRATARRLTSARGAGTAPGPLVLWRAPDGRRRGRPGRTAPCCSRWTAPPTSTSAPTAGWSSAPGRARADPGLPARRGPAAGAGTARAPGYDGGAIAIAPDGRVAFTTARRVRLDRRLRRPPATAGAGRHLPAGRRAYRTRWGRVFLDACLPAGTAVALRFVTTDDDDVLDPIPATPPARGARRRPGPRGHPAAAAGPPARSRPGRAPPHRPYRRPTGRRRPGRRPARTGSRPTRRRCTARPAATCGSS